MVAAVYATEEAVSMADANLRVANQNLAAKFEELETAVKSSDEAAKTVALAESSSARIASLLATGLRPRRVRQQPSRCRIPALQSERGSNRVSQAETSTQIASSQVDVAEASVREARAERGKAEVLVNPIKTLQRVIEYQQEVRLKMELPQPNVSLDPALREAKIQEIDATLNQLRSYLVKASEIDPANEEVHPTVRQAIEALNQAAFDLEGTTVRSPIVES